MQTAPPFAQLALAPTLLASHAQLPLAEGVISFRGGGSSGSPPSKVYAAGGGGLRDDGDHPPIGEVVGAGAVGALAGHVFFQSLLISAGLGVTAMSIAASSADGAGEIARSSGRMAVAVFDRTTDLNDRYQITERLVKGAKVAGRRLKEFDQEHAVVHRATEGAKKAWRDFKKYDEEHELTSRAGEVMTSGLDKLAEALTPPPSNRPVGKHRNRSRNRSKVGSSSNSNARNNTSRGHHGKGDGTTGGKVGVDLGRWWREGLDGVGAGRRGLDGAEGKGWWWDTKMRHGDGGGGRKRKPQKHQRSRDERDEQWSDTPF